MKNPRGSAAVTSDERFKCHCSFECGKAKPVGDLEARRPAYSRSSSPPTHSWRQTIAPTIGWGKRRAGLRSVLICPPSLPREWSRDFLCPLLANEWFPSIAKRGLAADHRYNHMYKQSRERNESVDLDREKHFFEELNRRTSDTGLSEERSVISNCEQRCPVCSKPNDCRIAAGHSYKGVCWCNESSVPSHILKFVAEKLETACFCRRCFDSLAYYAQYSLDPVEILDCLYQEIRNDPKSPDFYYDDLGRMVFTAAFHLRRGHCCENSCRHCPYSPSW